MASSSPVGSSPSKTPFGAPSKRYVSKVYSRRSVAGPSVPKQTKRSVRTPTPESDLSSLDDSDVEMAPMANVREVILGKRLTDSEDELLEPAVSFPTVAEGRPQEKRGGLVGAKATKGRNGVSSTTRITAKLPVTSQRGTTSATTSSKLTEPVSRTTELKSRLIARTDTETSITSATEDAVPGVDIPPITLQPATSPPPSIASSSQALPSAQHQSPSTPPRKRQKRDAALTPRSSPRDLSALFAPVSPAKSPALTRRNTAEDLGGDVGQVKRAGVGLYRRMLDKTQSLGAIASPAKSNEGDAGGFGGGDFTTLSPSGPPGLARTLSLPVTPSKTPAKEELAVPSLIVPVDASSRMEVTASGSGGRGKRTYGRSRTILAEVNDSPGSGVSSAGGDRDVIQESYAELRKQFEVDNSGEDGSSGNLMLDLLAVRGGQSVSDLRSKGENRRFMDELGYLVDPILDPSTSIGLKRSSIHDILRSMQDDEWLQRAKICGQVERIWEAIYEARGEGGDEVIEAMCLLYLINLVKSGSGLELVLRSHDESCERILLASIKVRDGPLDEVCRVKAAGTIPKLRAMYQSLDLGWTSECMSTRRLASYLLAEVTSAAIRPSSSTSLLVTEKAISRIAKSLTVDVNDLASRFDLVQKGLPLLPPDRKSGIDIDHVSQCLTVLSRLISEGATDRLALAGMHASIAPLIINALIAGVHLALNETGLLSERGSTIAIQSLQILATMCNSSSNWSASISHTDGGLTALIRVLIHRSSLVPEPIPIEAEESEHIVADQNEEEQVRFFSPKKPRAASVSPQRDQIGEEDVLCLVLVILTAAILGSETVVERLALSQLKSGCKGFKSCLLGCICPSAQLFVDHLITTYVQYKTSEASASSLIAAYIALILSKLILFEPEFLDLLPGSSRSTNLNSLIEVLSDLKGLQSLLQNRLKVAAGLEGGADGEESAIDGDEGVVVATIEDLKRMAGEIDGV